MENAIEELDIIISCIFIQPNGPNSVLSSIAKSQKNGTSMILPERGATKKRPLHATVLPLHVMQQCSMVVFCGPLCTEGGWLELDSQYGLQPCNYTDSQFKTPTKCYWGDERCFPRFRKTERATEQLHGYSGTCEHIGEGF